MTRNLIIPSLLSMALLSSLQPLHAREPVNTAPPKAPSETDAEGLQPEVNIIRREDKTIEEYRLNGRLYKIKVTPKNAPPYFLVDRDGDGSFETRRMESTLEPDLMIPQWVLFRW
jgi:Protein of unknown function (DUF2782)